MQKPVRIDPRRVFAFMEDEMRRNPYEEIGPMCYLSTRELLRFLSVKERKAYWFSQQLGNFRSRMLHPRTAEG